jgi:hypothetical protein
MEEGRSMKGIGVRGEGERVNLPMSLKFDGKSNWKAFYAKFSRYAEVSEWTEGESRDQLWYMCFSGNSLKALVAKDKTRSAQSSNPA